MRFIQEGGVSADSATAVSRAFSSNVSPNSLIVVVGTRQSPSSDAPVAGDCTKTAGTATISTPQLLASNQLTDTTGTPAFFCSAVYGMLVTNGGSLTLQFGGAPANSFLNMSECEWAGNWNVNDLIETSAAAGSDPDNQTSGGPGSITSRLPATLWIGGISIGSGVDPALTTPPAGWANIFYESRGSSSNPCNHARRVVNDLLTQAPLWSFQSPNNGYSAAVAVFKEALITRNLGRQIFINP